MKKSSYLIACLILLLGIVFSATATPIGRSVTIMLTLSESGEGGGTGPVDYMDQLLGNSVSWVGKGASSLDVLVIRDDNHSGEWTGDTDAVFNSLVASGYNATLIDEPTGGVPYSALAGYDVILLSNPGYPVDDALTVQSLQMFFDAGGGVILQGDDIAQGPGIESLTHLNFVDNGTSYYGFYTDNMVGRFYFDQYSGSTHPVIAGLEGLTFTYGDDIDTTTPTNTGEVILAQATIAGENVPWKPVISAYEAPIPEPGALLLLGSGLAGLAGYGFRRKKRT